jgi:hypothetical protein
VEFLFNFGKTYFVQLDETPQMNALAFIGVLMAVGLTVTNIFFFLKIGAYDF